MIYILTKGNIMNNQFIETNRISYWQNIKNSFIGAILGLILFIASFVLLWWNEGNRINLTKNEDFIIENTIILQSDSAKRKNDDKLVMINGSVVAKETLSDSILSVDNALNLKRTVEMYQWVETKTKTTSHNNMGGSTTNTTTYLYQKKWDNKEHNSDNFKRTEYKNPKFTFKDKIISASGASMGNFKIMQSQVSKIEAYQPINRLNHIDNYKVVDNYYYKGKNPSQPQIGDIRISYSYVPSGALVSIIGRQNDDNTISEMNTKSGSVYLQYDGHLTFDDMIAKYKHSNNLLTYIFRFTGWIVMTTGLMLLFNPITTIAKFIPLLSTVINYISNFILICVSLVLSLLTIAIAWITHRPLVAIGLFAVVFLIVYYIKQRLKKQSSAAGQQTVDKNIPII